MGWPDRLTNLENYFYRLIDLHCTNNSVFFQGALFWPEVINKSVSVAESFIYISGSGLSFVISQHGVNPEVFVYGDKQLLFKFYMQFFLANSFQGLFQNVAARFSPKLDSLFKRVPAKNYFRHQQDTTSQPPS